MLPIFKSYAVVFQGDSSLIHKIYNQQVNLVKEFHSYFLKPSAAAQCKRGKNLLQLDLSEKNLLPKKLLLISLKAKKPVDKLGYCGLYLQKKLPPENDSLKAPTTIDPVMVTLPNELVLTR